MHRVNTSRQTISSKQCNARYRPSGEKAAHMTRETFFDTRITTPVRGCIAKETFVKGELIVTVGSKFYMANYKWEGYFYVVVNQDGVWKCSSSDDRVQAACIALVQLHVQKRNNLLLNSCY